MPQTLLLTLVEGVSAGLIVALVGALLFHRYQKRVATGVLEQARLEAERIRVEGERIRLEAKRDADLARSNAALASREEAVRQREELERESKVKREEMERGERRADERSRDLDRRATDLDRQERTVVERTRSFEQREAAIAARETVVEQASAEQEERLERIAGLSLDDARREVLQRAEDSARGDAAALVRDLKEKARREAEKDGKKIVALAIQRLAAEHTAETTVSAVTLPNDEMKGRIIGREGRNIRAFESAAGVDLIIDDTPDTVVISCYDPVRREVGRRALEALIADGRIQPGRIEEMVNKARKELETQMVELGEQAAYDTGVNGIHPELIKLIGRMRWRTSYGQNILEHSKEVAWLAGMMASEMKLDVALAKRGGLLHDIGKVLTHDNEGTHVELGVEVAKKYGEKANVINCIAAHHDDVPHESVESVLVQAADAISGSRPGARREAFESYVKRLTRLEEIANGFTGVEKSNVIQAGREVRVIVTPEKIDDVGAAELAESIARRIEGELQYPGQIRVVVIRESRSVGIAK
jgi:ribonuclease Y